MIAELRRYPATKDSGVEWLGDVPAHWDVVRAKTLLRAIDVRSETGTEELLTVSSARGVVPRQSATVTMFKAQSYVGYKLCWHGDLVINSLWAWARGLGVARHHGIISSAYGVYRSKDVNALNPLYLDALVRSQPFQWELQVRSKGIWISRLQLTDEAFLNAPMPLPPPEEQAAIVRFLDHADRKIRRAIRVKQKLVKLLEEEKQAIIHRAVTRGLDPNIHFKPSGVEWLGDVPEHWQVVPLKYLCRRIQNGATPPTSERRYFTDGTVPWFGPSSIRTSNELGAPAHHLTEAAFNDGKARLIDGPAVLIIVIGATAGKMGLLIGKGATNQQITAFELLPGTIAPEFGIHQLRSAEPWLRSTASTATIPILDASLVNRLPLALPTVREQERILSAASNETLPLTTAISRLEREIELLREYRTRLIADVVTGKLDVREAAAQLPDDVEEPEEPVAIEDAPLAEDESEVVEANQETLTEQAEG